MKLIASRVGIPAEPAEAASLAPRQLECQGWLWQAADCQPGYPATRLPGYLKYFPAHEAIGHGPEL